MAAAALTRANVDTLYTCQYHKGMSESTEAALLCIITTAVLVFGLIAVWRDDGSRGRRM